METDTTYQNLSFGALEDYIGVDEPVDLQWFGNTSVSIFGFPNALIGSKANIQTTKPVSLRLCLSESLGHPTVSVIDTDISGDSYTWTPNNTLSNGEYSLEIWQNNGDFAFSHTLPLSTAGLTTMLRLPPKPRRLLPALFSPQPLPLLSPPYK